MFNVSSYSNWAKNSPIVIHAHGILVKGTLTAGQPGCRIESAITITLHGNRPPALGADPLQPIAKGIVVEGNGVLDLYGKLYHQSWTRLAVRRDTACPAYHSYTLR